MRRPWRTLRGRLALLTTAAVALAVGAACVSAFLLVRENLIGEVDKSLRELPVAEPVSTLPPPERRPASVTPRALQFDLQIIDATGAVSASLGPARLPVTAADQSVASGGASRLYDAYAADGSHVRVLVRHVAGGGAVMVGRPLTETDRTLARLGWLLIAVAGAGVLGAAGLGLIVARTGIRPVDRLTAAAERIALTEQPELLPVDGSDELSRLGRAFNAMVSALAASRDRQRQLILDAGHELRTPVTVLQTNIELLRRAEAYPGRLPAEQRAELLADLEAQARELVHLVGDVIELAHGDSATAEHVEVALVDPLLRAVDRAKLRAAPTVSFDVKVDDTVVAGDAAILERALVNLLDNAVKFGPPSQTVRVRLSAGIVTVADEGCGISDEDRPHVFDRFYRAAASRALPGSGLGLAIVARAADLHGARVSIEARNPVGTAVTIAFPDRLRPGTLGSDDAAAATVPPWPSFPSHAR